MPRRDQTVREHFKFDVEQWTFDYGFHVNAEAAPKYPSNVSWESTGVILQGPLRSKTKRRGCLRVELTLFPRAVAPEKWNPEQKGFGRVDGVRRGALVGRALLPSEGFHVFLTGLAAGRVQRCYLGIRDVVRGAGTVDAFFTIDPEKDDQDDE